MKVSIYCELSGVYLEGVRKMASDLEILATKEIPHDERVKALLKDPAVKDRTIRVRIGSPIFYDVMDYANDEEGKSILLGRKQYDSRELEVTTTPSS